jgi:hypothetical protein
MAYLTRFVLGFVGATLLASVSAAAPIEYRLSMTFGHDGFETPHPVLVGAHVDVVYRFDAALLIPTSNANGGSSSDWRTNWPTSNTTAIATVSGTGATDGTYAAIVESTGVWGFQNNVASQGDRDEVVLPLIGFAFNGGTVSIPGAHAFFNNVFQQGLSTIYPQPYSDGEATWINPPRYITANPNHRSKFINIASTAAFVPEPSAFALAATNLVALSLVRRRR